GPAARQRPRKIQPRAGDATAGASDRHERIAGVELARPVLLEGSGIAEHGEHRVEAGIVGGTPRAGVGDVRALGTIVLVAWLAAGEPAEADQLRRAAVGAGFGVAAIGEVVGRAAHDVDQAVGSSALGVVVAARPREPDKSASGASGSEAMEPLDQS